VIELLKDLGLLIWICTVDPILSLCKWAAGAVRHRPKPFICAALCSTAFILTWMSFDTADYSVRDSLILFWVAALAFVFGIKPIASSLLAADHD